MYQIEEHKKKKKEKEKAAKSSKGPGKEKGKAKEGKAANDGNGGNGNNDKEEKESKESKESKEGKEGGEEGKNSSIGYAIHLSCCYDYCLITIHVTMMIILTEPPLLPLFNHTLTSLTLPVSQYPHYIYTLPS